MPADTRGRPGSHRRSRLRSPWTTAQRGSCSLVARRVEAFDSSLESDLDEVQLESVIQEPLRGAIGDLRALQGTGLEGARRYVRGELPGPLIARLTGLHPTEAGLGKSTFSMPITRWFDDPFGLVWAGVFALLADAPLGTAIWTGLPPGKLVTTSELNLSFVRPFTRNTGNIVGRATSIHQGRQVGLAAVEISDREDRTMGYGTTRCLIVDAPVDPDVEYPEPDTGPDDPPDPF
jgi:uncharacterized protein (TIGR00369 family)